MTESKYELMELRAENFKRLVAVRVQPKSAGVTKLVGKNGAGKTSVLDAIEAVLGGKSACPKQPIRVGQSNARILLDLKEIVVERTFSASGDSKVIVRTKEGAKFGSPQKMLDALMGEISFDPLAFERMKPDEQVKLLAKIGKIDLHNYWNRAEAIRGQRQTLNKRIAEEQHTLKKMPSVDGLPDEEMSLAGITAKVEEIGEFNKKIEVAKTETKRLENAAAMALSAVEVARQTVDRLKNELAGAELALDAADKKHAAAVTAHAAAADSARGMGEPKPIENLTKQIKEAENLNLQIRQNKARAAKAAEIATMEAKYKSLAEDIEAIERERDAEIAKASLPVKGLGLTEKGVTYRSGADRPAVLFEQCSQAEKLRVSTAIGLALNSTLRIMLIRDGSLLDEDGMELLAQIAAEAGAQILVERVAAAGEMGIMIVDGETEGAAAALEAEKAEKSAE